MKSFHRTPRRKALYVALGACFSAGVAANPNGAVVVGGSASFVQSGKTLQITNTPGTIINWQGFSIGADETTRFLQSGASSAVLNRVVGSGASNILGQLLSNGKVFLLNPNGVFIGGGAVVDVAGFAASTLRMSDADFLAGRFKLDDVVGAGRIVNEGTIRTPEGGKVYLVAPNVENNGLITSPGGEIILAAGRKIELVSAASPDVRVELSAPSDGVLNVGEIVAEAGHVGIFGTTVRNAGTVSADSVRTDASGRIFFVAKDVALDAGSTVSANGPSGGLVRIQAAGGALESSGEVTAVGSAGKGGDITLTGQRVGLFQSARVDASGESGGGVVRVGGDVQGRNPEVPNAEVTYISPRAELRADALNVGDGGTVVVWADDTTRFHGTISARAGANGGDGGFVEVSGKDTLVYKGGVDTRAPLGKTGTLLLDPANIIIANGSGDSTDDGVDVSVSSFAGDPSGVVGSVASGDNPGGGTLTLFESELEGIAAGTNISLAATSTITINDLADNTLNLAQTGGGSVSFNAATFSMHDSDTITTAGAAINITATGAIRAGGLNAAGGAITLDAGAASSVVGAVAGTGTALNKLGAGNLILSGTNTHTGMTTVSAGTLTLSGGSAISNSGAVNLDTAGAALNVVNAEVVGSLSGVAGTTVNLNTATLTAGDSGNASFAGVIQGSGSVVKAGTGAWTLAGNNTYSGLTTVSAGTLKLGAAGDAASTPLGTAVSGTLVRAGATLDLNGYSLGTAEALALNGTGVSSGGALTNSAVGAASYSGLITLGMASSIVTDAGDINITNPGTITGATFGLALGGSGSGSIASVIGTTTGTVTKSGTGTWTLAGANTYTGATTVNAGTLQYGASNAINAGSSVVVNDGGALDLDNYSGTIAALTVNSGVTGGQVSTGTGTLTLGGNIASTGGASNAVISGNLNLGSATRTITTPAASDGLTISANISGTVGLTSAGAGTLTLSGENSYTGLTTISAGTLKLGAAGDATNTPLGTALSGTTVAAGAVLDLNGFSLGTAEALTLSGTGIANGGALTNSAVGDANYSGLVTLAAASLIETNAGAINLTNTGAITGTGLGLTLDGSGNGSIAGSIATLTGALTKNGPGTWTLTGTSNFSGATAVNAGTLAYAGAGGANIGQSAYTVNAGGRLLLDNSTANNNARVNDGSNLTLTGGEFAVLGNAAADTSESLGVLVLSSGHSTVTLDPDAAQNTRVNFGSLTRTAGATGLFRGTQLGNSTVASQTSGESNISFTAAPALTGGGGNAGTSTVSILNAAIGQGGVGGEAGSGSDFVTYNPPTGTENGLRPLLASEYAAAPAANVNLKLTADRSADDTFSINSLLLAGGVDYDINLAAGVNTLTITSGNVLSMGSANSIQNTQANGALAFGGTEAKLFAVADLTLGSGLPVTGTAGITKSGAGVLQEDRAIALTGGLIVNEGTLRSGAASAFASQALTVRSPGTFDLNGNNQALSGATSLTLESGANSGASVTGAGALTVAGNIAVNVNGSGATGATIGSNLALAAAPTITVNDGAAIEDLTIASVISGAGTTLTKAGNGTLLAAGNNTYAGTTSIAAGTFKLGAAGDGTNTPLGTVAGGTSITSGAVLDLNGFTLSTAEALTIRGTGIGAGGALANSSATAVDYAGLLTLGAASSVVANAGAINLTNTGTITGATFGLTLGGTGNGSLSGILGTTTGTLTKAGTGTWTLSGANTYTGATAISAGVLRAQNSNALGTAAGLVTIAAGAALELDGASLAIGDAINASGTGINNGGAIRSVTGTNSLTGGVTLAAATRINTDAGTLTVATGNITGTNQNLTVGGAGNTTVNSAITTGTGVLTTDGAGTLTLGGANTYTGATLVNAGTLQYGASNVINTGAVTVNDGGTLDLAGFSDSVGAVTVNSGNVGGTITTGAGTLTTTGTVTSAGGSNASIAGNLAMPAAATITVTNAGDTLNVAAIISGAGTSLTKAGTGTLILAGDSARAGSTLITAGTLKLGAAGGGANTPLGTTAGVTTVSAGAVLDLNGYTLGTTETLNLNGTGINGGGALINSSGTSANYSGAIAQVAASTVSASGGNINLAGNVSGAFALTLDGAANGSISGALGTAGTSIIKNGTGTWSLAGTNSYAGATTLNAGGLTLSGASGANNGATAYTINPGATLTLDNSAANLDTRIANGSAISMNGGELIVVGNAAADTNETVGALTLASGHSTITLDPDAAQNTRLTFASYARTAGSGATALFRGTQLGNSTAVSQASGESNIVFTGAPTLTGGGGAAGTSTVSILVATIGAGGANGETSAGTDFLTYNPSADGKGLRPLAAGEYTATPTANANVRLAANRSVDETVSINSLLMSGGASYDFNPGVGANSLTVTSGNVLSVGGANSIQNTQATGNLVFGATDAKFFALSDLALSSPTTGTAGISKSGTGVFAVNNATALTGGLIVNQGTLRSGAANAFASQALTVRSPGTFDLNGNSQILGTATAMTLESGTATGATVTGAGTLSIGGNVVLNVRGTGAAGATVASDLSLNGANRTVTINNGGALEDLTVSGVISGPGFGIIKAGAGTMTLGGVNAYTGATTISAGTLTLNATGNIEASSGVANAGILSIASNKTIDSMTGAGATALGSNTLTIGDASGTSGTYTGVISGTGGLTTAGNGILTLGGVSTYTGATTIGTGSTLALNATGTIAGSSGVANAGTLSIAASKIIDSMSGAGNTVLGANTLTIGDASNTSSIYAGVISGTGGITKAGTGTLTLSGDNSYDGLTTIAAGTLQLGATGDGTDTPLGTVAAGTSITAGAVLDLNGFTLSTAEALTIRGTGIGAGGALANSSATAADYAGLLTLGAASSVVANAGAINLTNTGTITGATFGLTLGGTGNGSLSGILGTTTGTLTKAGTGTWTLSGANSYTGATAISAGVLRAQNSTALGTAAGLVTITAGAALELDGASLAIGDAINASGTGINNGGAIRSVTGTNSLTGGVTLAAATRINTDAGTLTVATGNITGTNQNLTVGGAGNTTVNSAITTGTGVLTTDGAGTLTLGGANTYTGATLVNAGTLQYGASNVINTGAVTVNDGGTLDLAGFSDSVGAVTVNSGNVGGTITTGAGTLTTTGTVTSAGGSNASIAGNLAMPAAATITVTNAGDTLNVAAIISGAATSLTKAGTGTLVLSGANTHAGSTLITAGTLKLGTAGNASETPLGTTAGATSITAGAVLDLNGYTLGSDEALTLRGTGINAAGALINSSGTAANYSGLVTLGSASSIVVGAGDINLTNAGTITGATFGLTLAGSGNGSIASGIGTTTGTLIKNGTGTWSLAGAGSYTGATTINAGVLRAQNSNAFGTAAGGVTIVAGAALEIDGSGIAIADAITANGAGVVNGGAVRNVSGANSLTGGVVLGSATRINADAGTLTVATGNITGAAQGLTVGGAGDVTVNSNIATTSGTVTKDGSGTLTLAGANTYTGLTTINAGALRAESTTALGTAAGGVTIASGAALEINGTGLTIAEAITANGTGVANDGAVRNVSGTNSLTGGITLGSATRINADAGTLTIATGNITGATQNLTVGGAGNTTVSSNITTTSGAVTKDGAGTLTLSGVNTFTGLTTISNGVLRAQNNAALGTSAGGTTIDSGAALELNGGTLAIADAITINGDGVSGTGAIRSIAGTNSITGGIALGSASRVNTDAGTLSISTGGISGSADLAVGGAGNTTINSVIATGNGALTKDGLGTLTLANAGNSFTGALNLNNGTTSLASLANAGANSGAGAGSLIVLGSADAATLQYTGSSASSDRALTVGGTAGGTLQMTGAAQTLTLGGVVTGTAGPLTLAAGTNSVAINGAGNALGTVNIISGNDITLRSDNLTLGPSTVSGALDVRGTGDVTVAGTQSVTGAVTIAADGTLALDGSINTSATGNAITLAGNTAFTRDAGANLSMGGGGRWVIYSADPDLDTFNGLASGNTAIWNKTFAANPPSGIASGNRYVFALSPTLTYTSTDIAKTYGDDVSAVLPSAYSVNGLRGNLGGVVVADTLGSVVSGAAAITSAGAAATAGVAGSPYVVNIGAGTLAASSGYTLAYDPAGRITVARAALSVTADNQSKVYGATDPALTYTVNAAQLKNGDATSVVTGMSLTAPTGSLATAGTHVIAASGGTAANYTINPVNGTLTVDKAALTITAADKSKVYGAADPALTANYAGLQYLDTSAVVSGLTLNTQTGTSATAGTHAIVAANGTASNYDITHANGTLTVDKAALTITAADKSKVYGAADPALTANYAGLQYLDTSAVVSGLTLNTQTGTSATAGTHAIVAANGTASNYDITHANGTLSVDKAPLTITAADKSKVYGAADPALTANYSGLQYLDTSAVVSGLTLNTQTGAAATAGTHAIVAANGTASNYDITHANGTLTVDKAALTITAADKSKVYGAADPTLTANYSGLQYLDTSAVVSGLTLTTQTGASATAGTHAIVAANGIASNYDITHANGTLTVDKAALTITAADKSKVYGAADPALTANYSGLQYLDTSAVVSGLTLNTQTGSAAIAGTHAIVAANGTASNYDITHANGTLTVAKAALTATADDKAKVYGATDPALTFSVGGTLYYGDTGAVVSGVSLATQTGAAATAGTHAISASGGTAANYDITTVDGTLTVAKAALTATADDKAKIYGAADPALTYSVGGTLYYSDTAAVVSGISLSTQTGAAATAGTHAIVASGGVASNYDVTAVNGTLTVGKAALTLTADDKAKTYGGADPALTVSAGSLQLKYSDTLSVVSGLVLSTATGASATAGTHTIAASGGTAANYDITTADGTLTVAKAALIATADDKAKVYGATDPALTYSVGGTLHYGDSAAVVSGVSLSTQTGAAATAGTHAIVTSGGVASNYDVTAVNGTLSVGKAPLTLKADDKAKIYGDPEPLLTASAGALQLKYSDTLSVVSGLVLSTATGSAATAGTHVIAASGGTAANYDITHVTGTQTVGKAPLSVVADDKIRDLGTPNPVFTASISGYKLGETASVLGGTLQFTTAATPDSPSGIYAIQPYGLSAANYTFYYGAGNLFVGSTAGASTTGVTNQMTVPVAGLTTALQGDPSAFGTSSIVVTLPGGFSFLNALPATGAGVAGAGGAAGAAANSDEPTPGESETTNDSVSPTRQVLMRANCFGQPLQRLKCAAR